MEKLFLFLPILLLFPHKTEAQFWEHNFIYGNAGISAGNYLGAEAGLNYIKNENIYLGLSYANRSKDAENKPNDYSGGWFGSNEVKDIHHSFSFSAGYIKILNPKKTIRINLKGGIGLRWSRMATNFQRRSTGSGWFSSYSYSFEREDKYSFEASINPTLEFPLARGYGLSVGPLIAFGNGPTFIGSSLNNIFGITRGKTQPKTTP